MKKDRRTAVILGLSLPLAALLITASCTGLLVPGFYAAESFNWQVQSAGQDKVDLFLLSPVLLISAWYASRKNQVAWYTWGGTVLYLLYTFVIYCTAVHFNRLFLVYCFGLGLSFYSTGWFLLQLVRHPTAEGSMEKIPSRLYGIYFISITVVFYVLWLAEIVPALLKGIPPVSVTETGLITNTVQVLDLSVFLPLVFLTGFFVLRRKYAVYPLIPVLLSFFVLMDVTIGILALLLKKEEEQGNKGVAFIMGVLAVISFGLLRWFYRRLQKKE